MRMWIVFLLLLLFMLFRSPARSCELDIYIIADTHYGGENAIEKRLMMRQYCYEWMWNFSNTVKASNADAIFQMGDLADRQSTTQGPRVSQEEHLRRMDEAYSILAASGVPIYSVLGNHGIDTKNTTKEVAAPHLGLPMPPYYSFNLKRFHFIVLDNYDVNCLNDFVIGETYEEHFRIYEAEEQWLRQDLKRNRNKPIIVLTHVSLSGYFENVQEYRFRRYNSHSNGPAIREILRGYPNVMAVLEGHYHNIIHYNVSMYQTYVWEDGHVKYIGIPSLINWYSQQAYGRLQLSLKGRVVHFSLETTSTIGRLIEFDFTLTVAPSRARIYILVNRLELLAPYIGPAILFAVAASTVVYVKKRKRDTESSS